jgi:hypothetical protein
MNIVLVMRSKPVSRVHGIVALVQRGEAVGAVYMNNLLIDRSKQVSHMPARFKYKLSRGRSC